MPSEEDKPILTDQQQEKILLLNQHNIENLIIIPFTIEFSRITSSHFVKHFLLEKLQAKNIRQS
jgi:FAD synthase